jgi:energy-coupling factor transporter ATP-binding protein EcfA2
MAEKISHTKVTGGGGFVFEDKVAAFFISCLLSRQSPLDPSLGTISSIDFQVRADGWLLDDILITLNYGDVKRRCAFSIKSNAQFSKTTAPSDFVRKAWEQYLHEGTSLFNKETDKLGIITTPLGTDTKSWLDDLLNKARCQQPDDFTTRIKKKGYVSKEEGRLYESFSCPQTIADKHSISEDNIGELLKCIEHLQFDFEYAASSKHSEAISMLRKVLVSDLQEEAIRLWESLCCIASDLRPNGGYIDLPVLIDKLRLNFGLKDHPDNASIWEKLIAKTKEELSLIPSQISDKVSISRDKEISEIEKILETNSIVVLIGASGCGKTVIEKTIAETNIESCKVIWINAENTSILEEISTLELFKVIPDSSAYLVLDGLDRFFETRQFKETALLINSCFERAENSPWKIVVSCQPEEWSRVQNQLLSLNVNAATWKIINIENPSYEDLEPVWAEYPSLRKLRLHKHLTSFLYKLKVLDLFARKLQTGGAIDSQGWVGESDLIKWFWELEIDNHPEGLKRGTILKRIAEKIADELVTDLSASDFLPEELTTIEELIKDRILKKREERISFEHDLVADWARQKLLLEKLSTIPEYINNKLLSTLWCRALRLIGLHFLETEPDINKWKSTLNSFVGQKEKPHLGQDILLEASIFSADPLNILEKMWGELKKDKGLLLRRLLNRFLYTATFPKKIALLMASKYADEPITELTAPYNYRDPYWPYWLPVIEFIHKHKDDVIMLAKEETAIITDKWLRYAKSNWPMRNEAAEIAIEIAEEMLAFKMSNGTNFVSGDLDILAFRAGLAACNEQATRTIEFALIACSRRDPSGIILNKIAKNNEEKRERIKHWKLLKTKFRGEKPPPPPLPYLGSREFAEEKPPPWPEGPKDSVDPCFQQICLNTDALYPLIMSDPSNAREILMALLIEHPTPKDIYGNDLERYRGLECVHEWFPAFYTHGPFLSFLSNHPDEGLDLILSLINFTTERWAEAWTDQEPPSIEIEFSWGKKKFIGNALTYYWYREVDDDSHIVPSALMALEQWLYINFNAEEFKEKTIEFIDTILKNATSLAFIGLLISLGKKHTELFLDKLLPLLSISEFYKWDTEHIIKSESHQMIGSSGLGWGVMDLAKEFHSMPHRKYQLSQIALNVFIKNESLRSSFEHFRNDWKKRFDKGQYASYFHDNLENLIHWFDISNWKPKKDPEHGEILGYEIPKEILNKRESGIKENQEQQLLVLLPLNYRQVLNGKQSLANDQGEAVLNTIQQVATMILPEDNPDNDILRKENAICGGIAVLFKHYREWLAQDPKKEKWCIEKIINVILNPPEASSFDSEHSSCDYEWDRFCAEIMPVIWADEVSNPLYRKCMAKLTVNPNYETVRILFKTASALRGALGNNFKQLQNFLIRWAHARWKYTRERHTKKKTFDVNKWLEREVEAFKKGKISAEFTKWDIVAKEAITKRRKLIEKEIKKRGMSWHAPKEIYFDVSLIQAAFNWMPGLDKAHDRNEREEWLKFCRQALAWSLNMAEKDDCEEVSGIPNTWDKWVFEQVAYQILFMEDDEKPNELWMPILDLGYEAHYWIEFFLMEWFLSGIGSETVSRNFTKRWKEMLEYTLSSGKWNPTGNYRNFHLNQMWCYLLGMQHIISKLWNEDRKSVIREMKGYYKKWAAIFLSDSDSAVLFVNFLQQPATREILFDGLVWLEEASNNADKHFFNERNSLQTMLANLLEISWQKHKDEIVKRSDTFESFKSLLRKLVDMQNPQAMEIQQKMR